MEDYKIRFVAEYTFLKDRVEKLTRMLGKWDAGILDFVPTCPRSIYNLQLRYMTDYLTILEARAKIENIEL
jgi:hypothetical protein